MSYSDKNILSLLLESDTKDEFAMVLVENWEKNDLDNLSYADIADFKKYLTNKGFYKMVNRLSPVENFSYNRYNFSRLILSFVDTDKVVHQKLRFLIWHMSVLKKVYNFITKVNDNVELSKKLNLLLKSLKSISGMSGVISRNDMAKKYLILSDLAAQLGYHLFSLMSAKKSLKNDPDFMDAAIFMGKAYIELGTTYTQKKAGYGTYQYNLEKSRDILRVAMKNLEPEKKHAVSQLVFSVSKVLSEISRQRVDGKLTVAQQAIEEYIDDKLESVEQLVVEGYEDSDFKFVSNISEDEKEDTMVMLDDEYKEEPKEEHYVKGIDEAKEQSETLKVQESKIKTIEPNIPKKPGKLYDNYINQADFKKPKVKEGNVSADEIGYKVSPKDVLSKILKEKNEELKRKLDSEDSDE